jgi:hypothetical protein
MNLIIAIFLYLGLTYPGDTITRAEMEQYSTEIEVTQCDPEFISYYEQLQADGGLTHIDIHCGE